MSDHDYVLDCECTIQEQQTEIDRLRGLLGEWVSEAEQRPYVYRAHRSHQVCICLTCRTRKELEPTDGNT